jgi:hypothetical protein
LTNQLEFFFVFVTAHIIHLTQLVDLFQRQAGLAQIAQGRLTVVLTQVLVCFRFARINFVKDHVVFITKVLEAHQPVLRLE